MGYFEELLFQHLLEIVKRSYCCYQLSQIVPVM